MSRFCLIAMLIGTFLTGCSTNLPIKSRPAMKIGMFADVQYCDCEPEADRYYRLSKQRLQDMVDYFNKEEPDVVINLGDLIEEDFENYYTILPELKKLRMPVYHLLGNHDYEVDEIKKDSLYDILNLERGYYDVKKEGWKFIVLDGNDLSYHAVDTVDSRYLSVDSLFEMTEKAGKEQARKWNGALGGEQLAWLENHLKTASESGEKVVLFCHYPVYPPDIHNLWNAEHVIEILEKYDCVKAWFSGHNHNGNYNEKKGIHYLTLKGMVQTADSTAFSLIDMFPDSLVVTGVGREASRVLTLKK